MATITSDMMGGDVAPKVSAFRAFMMNITEQLCQEFEREVSQMSEDIVKYRGELARCADLLAFQLGKEKQYHEMLENVCSNTQVLVGRSGEVGQKHSGNEDQKRAMMQMIDDMFDGSSGMHGGIHSHIDEHRYLAEQHLMSSSELQNQSKAVQQELDNILEALKMPPVSYNVPPVVMGPSMMGGQQQYGGAPKYGAARSPPGTPSTGIGMLNSPLTQGKRSGPPSPTSPFSPRGAQNRIQTLPGGVAWS
jgi:hypothetical protein